jgi:hypothetical protein
MKYLSGAFALLLLINIFAFAQTEQSKQQTDSPTLDETVKWLSQQLPALAAYEGRLKTSAITLRVISAAFEGQSCTLVQRQEIITSGSVTISNVENRTYIFSLATLDPEKISVERMKVDCEPPKYDLTLNTKGEKKAIRYTNISKTTMLSPYKSESMTNSLILGFDSEETARRFEKAFEHAAKLAQASSKEPF